MSPRRLRRQRAKRVGKLRFLFPLIACLSTSFRILSRAKTQPRGCPLPAGWTPAPDALLGGRCRWGKGRFASARPPGGDRSQPRRPRRPGTTLARGVLLAPREGAAVPAVQDSGVGRRGRVRGARAGWLRGPAPRPQAPGPRLGEEACGRGGPPVALWARERPTAAPAAASSGSAKLAFRIPELRAGCRPAPRAL